MHKQPCSFSDLRNEHVPFKRQPGRMRQLNRVHGLKDMLEWKEMRTTHRGEKTGVPESGFSFFPVRESLVLTFPPRTCLMTKRTFCCSVLVGRTSFLDGSPVNVKHDFLDQKANFHLMFRETALDSDSNIYIFTRSRQ